MGGPLDYTVSFLGQVIVIVISRPRSLTINDFSKFWMMLCSQKFILLILLSAYFIMYTNKKLIIHDAHYLSRRDNIEVIELLDQR